ncbi:DUF3888 domain-containing protein [Psychrobacillus sp. NPDC096389]|uniref:DUF3888 domain-containing protein n=1 Tax=Psychrobacillus sp. NPDC096389 TaxID=3364490 RepID=UPI0038237D77
MKQKFLWIFTLIVCFVLLIYFIPKVSAFETAASADREMLLEETLLHQLENNFYDITNGKAYFCEKILNIERINNNTNSHKLTVQLVTYEGAHSQPFNLYVINFTLQPFSIFKLLDVEETKDVPIEKAEKLCKK